MYMRQEAWKTIKLALPIVFGNVSQMALGILDNAMVGAISYQQLAAASLVVNILGIPYVLGIGMTMSISPMVALSNGERNKFKVSHYFFNGFLLCALISLLIAGTVALGNGLIFHLNQDPVVAALAQPYLKIMGWSTIPMIMFLAIIQFTDGLEHTEMAMILSVVTVPINAFLNWLLIYGNWGFPRLELIGAGYATLITRIIVLLVLVGVVCLHRNFRRYVWIRRSTWKLKAKTWKELLKIGIPSSMQYGMEAGAFSVSGIMVGWLGAVSQAAHQIALSCASLTFMVALGLSQAGSIRVSNALGRKDMPLLRRIGLSTLVTALIYGSICALAFIVLRNQLPYSFNKETQVVGLAAFLLLFAAFFQISDSIQAVGVGLLRGLRDVKIPTLLVAIAYWVIGIPVGYLLAFHFRLGAMGLWIGFVAGLSLSAIFMSARFMTLSRKMKPAEERTLVLSETPEIGG